MIKLQHETRGFSLGERRSYDSSRLDAQRQRGEPSGQSNRWSIGRPNRTQTLQRKGSVAEQRPSV